MNRIFKTTVWVALSVVTPLAAAGAPAVYEVVQRLALGHASRYDYIAVEPAHRRLYVTRGDHIDVLALPSGERVGTIDHTEGVHGVAFDAARGVGFASDGASNAVTVFDLATLQVKTKIALPGKKPDAILFDPSVDKLYVFNGHSDTVDVLDGKTLSLQKSIQTSGDPEFAVADGHGRIFFNLENHPAVEVIDTAADRIVATWALDRCDAPTGIALDGERGRLISTCQNHTAVVTDAAAGKEVARFPIGGHPDAIIIEATTHTIYTACGEGSGMLSIVDALPADRFVVRQELKTMAGARTLALDKVDGRVYLPTVIDDAFVVGVAAPRPLP